MRSIALDVHRGFCEVAIKDGTEVRPAGRIKTSRAELELFAQSLAADDQVALEATGPALQIKRLIEPHVARVVIANTRKLRAIAEAKVKTDKVDARTLCELLAAGFLPAVFGPDEETRTLRRRLARRAALVRQRTRAKNELHAVLARNLKGRPPMSDVFGVRGREWLSALPLPADERETVAGCLRQVDFLDQEVGLIERELAKAALRSAEIRRLMSVPGVNLVSAATFWATVGDIRRFETPRKLVSYVGLDPRVRQSGEAPARHGHISKQGSPAAPPHALRGGLDRRSHAGAVARLLRAAAGAARCADRARRHGAQALRAVLAPAHQGGGLRLRAAVASPPQAASAGACRRRSVASRAAVGLRGVKARATPRARAIGAVRARLPPAHRGLAGQAEAKRCGCDTGARILKASRKSQAARQASAPRPAL